MEQENNILHTQCCIVGGGPAGMMLGYLLARGGVDVMVLEKHKDFFRDFRGDTIHPSTSQLMYELGILDDFLKVPHQQLTKLAANFNGKKLELADFTHLHTAVAALGLMPQWDFLAFIKSKAEKYPSFHLMMEAEGIDIIKENGTVTGVKVKTPEGDIQINASLVVGTDGRHSTIREKAALKVIETATPIDVLWFRLSKKDTDPSQVLGWFDHGRMMIMLDRAEYWQCAYVIEKGAYDGIQQKGLETFKNEVVSIVAFLQGRMDELKSFDEIKLLSVAIDHLAQWYDTGLLCIGDAAHAMSPIGGVGINIAIQDAVAAANILYEPLKKGNGITVDILKQVQKRREFPMRFTQKIQTVIQNGIKYRKGEGKSDEKAPFMMRVINALPILRRIPAWIVGVGIRPEHIKTPEIKP